MNKRCQLTAACKDIKITLSALDLLTNDQLEMMPDEAGWHIISDTLSAAERLRETYDSIGRSYRKTP